MIKLFINIIKCKIYGHSLIPAGSCPYTGSTYNLCEKCEIMIPVDKAVD
jgi:hypothetical protein